MPLRCIQSGDSSASTASTRLFHSPPTGLSLPSLFHRDIYLAFGLHRAARPRSISSNNGPPSKDAGGARGLHGQATSRLPRAPSNRTREQSSEYDGSHENIACRSVFFRRRNVSGNGPREQDGRPAVPCRARPQATHHAHRLVHVPQEQELQHGQRRSQGGSEDGLQGIFLDHRHVRRRGHV